ncbi:MAG: AAA family ATPase, partial [bacterium]|nr:AAA family ATPase [bacterium]
MIIESVAIEGVRNLRRRVEIGPLTPGLNVLVAPNGTGKSTVIDAIVAGLVQSYKTTGIAASTRLANVAHQLTPKIELVLRANGHTYRLRKQFLKDAGATLDRLESGIFEPFNTDKDAVETWLEAQLGLERPGSGVPKSANYGVGALLWARQADPRVESLPDLQRSRLNAHAGADAALASPRERRIVDAVREQFERYYTSGGKAKAHKEAEKQGTAQLPQRRKELAEREAEQHELEARLQGADEARARYDAMTAEIETAERKRAELSKQLAVLKVAADRARATDAALELAAQRFASAQENADAARGKRGELEKARVREEALRPQVERDAERLGELDAELARAEEALKRGRAELDAARAAEAVLETERSEIADLRSYVTLAQREAELAARVERARTLLDDLDARERAAAAIAAPDADAWQRIERAAATLHDASRDVEAASLTLRFTPERDVTADVRVGEPAGPQRIAAGREFVLRGLGRLDVAIEGVGTLAVGGPAQSESALREAHARAQRDFDDAMQPFAPATMDELRTRRAERAAHDAEIATLQAKRDELLRDDTLAALEGLLNAARDQRDALLDAHPAWRAQLPDADAMERALQPRIEAAKAAQAAATLALAQHEELAAARGAQRATLASEIDERRIELEALRKNIAAVDTAALDALSDEASRRALEAKSELERLERERAARDGDPVVDYERTDAVVREIGARLERDRPQQATYAVQVEGAAQVRERLETVAADVATRARALAHEEARAAALKRLRETIEKHANALTTAVAPMLQDRMTAFARRIFNRDDITVSFDLQRLELALGMKTWEGKTVSDTISGGEREQLELAARLAMGSLLAKDEPQV